VADITTIGSISPGVHQCSVIFVTRHGYWTAPSPPVSWTAAGGKQAVVTNIPTGPSKMVLEDDAGQVVMASLARLTCELYLLINRDAESAKAAGNPRERYARLLALHKAGEQDLLARGLDDAHAWLPPPIAKRFGRRLTALGWVRDDAWTPYCFRLRANQK
jgi:hypothetical protein